MKRKILVAACVVGLTGVFSSNAQADDAECGIWLCLPASFPAAAGCAASKAAMIERVRDFKSPLPAFSSCSASGSDDGHNFTHGTAAYVPRRSVCTGTSDYAGGGCSGWRIEEAHYVHGTSCRTHHESGATEPVGCTKTVNVVSIFANGQQQGSTYYW